MRVLNKKSFGAWAAGAALVIGGCQTLETSAPMQGFNQEDRAVGPTSQSLNTYYMREGVKNLKEGNLREATALFRVQLKFNPQHAAANFFNGLIYHMKAKGGDVESLDLALVGYEFAVKHDPSNPVYHYYKGLVTLDKQDYRAASASFANAYMLNPKSVRPLYGLAVSAYYNHDLQTAAGAIEQALKAEPDNALYLRTGAIVMAAANQQDRADLYAARLVKLQGAASASVQYVQNRLATWKEVHGHQNESGELRIVKEGADHPAVQTKKIPEPQAKSPKASPLANQAKYSPPEVTNPYDGPMDGAATKSLTGRVEKKLETIARQPKPLDAKNQMVMVDLIIIIADETITEGVGVNLLNGIVLALNGSSSSSSSQAGPNFFTRNVSASKTIANKTINFSTGFSIQAASAYSLNIANVGGSRSEIIARPSLTALSGNQASFTSGNDIVIASASGDNSVAGPFSLGVSVVVTPTLLENGKVNLNIQASRKSVNDSGAPSGNTFSNSLFTAHTSVQSTVVMNLGDTLILGGLSERSESTSSDHTPIFGDLPIIQYLFHRDTKTQYRKSVIFLVTPRLPDYTYLEAFSGPDADPSAPEVQALLEFKAKYTDWFKPYPNIGAAFKHLQAVGVYREFRNGDALVESWGDLEQAIQDINAASGNSVDM